MAPLPDHFPAPDPRYRALHDSGLRPLTTIHNVCIHSTESETAESSARWFAHPTGPTAKEVGSAQLVIGDYAGFRTLPDNVIPWAAPPLNTNAVHIEIVGYADFSEKEWMENPRRLHWAAYQTCLACIRYRLPVSWCNVAALRAKSRGITAHYVVSETWHLTDHVDPGPDFPYDYFMRTVHGYMGIYGSRVKPLI